MTNLDLFHIEIKKDKAAEFLYSIFNNHGRGKEVILLLVKRFNKLAIPAKLIKNYYYSHVYKGLVSKELANIGIYITVKEGLTLSYNSINKTIEKFKGGAYQEYKHLLENSSKIKDEEVDWSFLDEKTEEDQSFDDFLDSL